MRKTHFTCPLCGRRAADRFLSREFPIAFWVQEFGWFRGQPRPTMSWKRITDGSMAQALHSALIQKLAAVAARVGYRLEPLRIGVSLIPGADISVSQGGGLISVITKPEVRRK